MAELLQHLIAHLYHVEPNVFLHVYPDVLTCVVLHAPEHVQQDALVAVLALVLMKQLLMHVLVVELDVLQHVMDVQIHVRLTVEALQILMLELALVVTVCVMIIAPHLQQL